MSVMFEEASWAKRLRATVQRFDVETAPVQAVQSATGCDQLPEIPESLRQL